MKREKLLSCLSGGLLAFCIGFGGVACMVTGLKLTADLTLLALGCALGAAIAAGCFYFRRGGMVLWAGALLYGFYLAYNDDFLMQLLAMAGHTMSYYDRAYGIAIPEALLAAKTATHLWPLLVIGGMVSALCCRTVCRARSASLTVIAAILPLAACLVVTDTVPDTLWLFLLLFGLSLLVMTQLLRRRDPTQGTRLTAMLALPLAAVLMLLFVLVPRGTAPNITESLDSVTLWLERLFPQISANPQSGLVLDFGNELKQEVDLGAQGRRREWNIPVMEVTATFSDTLYLRGRSYVGYDGRNWKAAEGVEEDLTLMDIWLREERETITVETVTDQRFLYLPYYPTAGQTLTDGWAENSTNDTLYTQDVRRLSPGWQIVWLLMFGRMDADQPAYDLDAALSGSLYEPPVPSNEIYYDGIIPTTADPMYLELPDNTNRRASQILLRDIVPELGASYSQLDMAKKIEEYVRASAEYDLNPGKMPEGEDFALWFLERSDKGYCVHFASAAVVLLRSAGIPARYVEGYMTQVEAGKTVTIRDKMAHAWVEYYLTGLGWLVMDPTPADSDTPPETTAPTEKPTEPTEGATSPPTEPSETAPTQTAHATDPSIPRQEEKKEPPKWLAPLLIWLASLFGAAAAVWGQWRLRRNHIQRSQRSGSSNTRALARWRETVRLCRLLRQKPPEDLRALAEKAKFSQYAITAAELSRFAAVQQELVAQMRSHRWYKKLVYRLIFAAY